MSKKDLVKRVIDGLIKEGDDFFEITQGTLAKVDELEGVSKTTIKRAKNEYKKERIVVQKNYKENLIKRKIYKYLDKNPKSTLSDIRDALPEVPPSKVSEYHQFWKRKREIAETGIAPKSAIVSSRKLKEMIFDYLGRFENVTTEQLYRAFPESNRSSVSSYFGHWKKKQVIHETGKAGSLFQVIFNFMDSNSNAGIDDLKESFSDVPRKTLEIYHNLWLKKQKKETTDTTETNDVSLDQSSNTKNQRRKNIASATSTESKTIDQSTIKKKKVAYNEAREELDSYKNSKTATKKTEVSLSNMELSAEDKLIKKLRKTIERQKITLTALEVEHSILKESQPEILKELEGVSQDELKDVEEFIITYMEGMRAHKQP
ncbi:hypothetical protein KKA14_11115 [bacterium]|nr:hypothetical protein [bacterium]